MPKVRTTVATLGVVLALVLTACGSEEPAPGGGGGGQASPEPTGSTAGATVLTGETELGTILTDAEGLTLYMFGADENGESTCYDDCAATWPALTVEGEPVAGEGVDAAELGTTERTDGSVQVTYAGLPLYRFASDAAPGDTNGQGINDIWYVVAPDGTPIEGGAPPPGYGS